MKPLEQNAYLQRYVRGDEDVDADVKLAAADEEGIIDVPLNHIRLGSLLRLLRLVVLTLILSLLRETKKQLDLETGSRRRYQKSFVMYLRNAAWCTSHYYWLP